MMELTPLKRIGTFAQYKLKRFRDLDNNLLARLHKEWPAGATHAVFQFGERVKNEQKVSKPLLPKYNVALIYSARPAQIKVKKVPLPETLRPGRELKAKLWPLFMKQTREMLRKHKGLAKKLGPAFRKETASVEKFLVHSRNSGLYRDGRLVSLSIVTRRKNYLGENCDWLLWSWAASDLTKKETAAELEFFFDFAKKTMLPVEFKTRSFALDSQKLARDRGFALNYVTVAKMV